MGRLLGQSESLSLTTYPIGARPIGSIKGLWGGKERERALFEISLMHIRLFHSSMSATVLDTSVSRHRPLLVDLCPTGFYYPSPNEPKAAHSQSNFLHGLMCK